MTKPKPIPSKPSKRATEASGVAVRCSYSALEDVANLKANPRNPNKHPSGQLELYAKAIRHQGWRRAVVVSKRSGLIVTGHGAVECAKAQGWSVVPVDYQDFESEADELAHCLADNRLPELAEMSESDLAAILSDLKAEPGFDLDLTGFDLAGLQSIGFVVPDFQPTSQDEQGRLDQKAPVTCPKCGHEFTT
jgi:hypothetical protein